jgi:dihydropteroate synthase
MNLRCGNRELDLAHPVVMGVLNVTPDSFSDGGRYFDPETAVRHALDMIGAGAALIDVGGESTRPGADAVSAGEEMRRVVPVIRALAAHTTVPISIDTSKPEVMLAAVQAGAGMINDVRALQLPGALAAAADTNAAICLMHMQGEPRTMQDQPAYGDVVAEVRAFLAGRVRACVAAGIGAGRLVLDPGIGFGKRLEHNLALLAALPSLRSGEMAALPLMIGVSRKSMFGTLLGRAVEERLAGGLAAAAAAVLAGANILRTHDVAQTVDAVRVADALRAAGYGDARSSAESGTGG